MTYTVKAGDSLSKIARDVLGDIDLWPAIQSLNNIADPNRITVGQVLVLPDPGTMIQPGVPVQADSNATAPVTKPAGSSSGPVKWVLIALAAIGIGVVVARKKKKEKK